MPGIVVIGGSRECGKTTLIAGLALALKDNGFRVQTYKPLELETVLTKPSGLDQQYFNTITRQYIQAETLVVSSAWEVSPLHWVKMMERCRNLEYPSILEAPGQVSTPWQMKGDKFQMAWDVARELAMSAVVVVRSGQSFVEETYSALSLLQAHSVSITGIIRVHCQPNNTTAASEPTEPLALSRLFAVTFLGDLPYSPSISVPAMQQGNLTRLTQENIDLLPIQMAMGLTL